MNNSDIETYELENAQFQSCCVSCIGGRSENQDSCGITETARGLLVVVCDGMGGLSGGAIASKTAVEEITNYISQPSEDSDLDNKTALLNAITCANDKLYGITREDPSLSQMGTTVTALLINEDRATVAYVGDSRIYQIRRGRKVFRTFDHSMVFELVRKKILSEEQARLSAQSNIILRALGLKPEVEADAYDLPYDKDDIFMLCTDGIWGSMPEKQLISNLSLKSHIRIVAQTLAMKVHNIGLENGGHHDNLSAALVKTNCNSKLRNKMEDLLKKSLIVCSALLLVSLTLNVFALISLKRSNAGNAQMPTEQVDSTSIKK